MQAARMYNSLRPLERYRRPNALKISYSGPGSQAAGSRDRKEFPRRKAHNLGREEYAILCSTHLLNCGCKVRLSISLRVNHPVASVSFTQNSGKG